MIKIRNEIILDKGMKLSISLRDRKEQRVPDKMCKLSSCRVDKRDKVEIIGWDQNKEWHEC